MKTFRDAVLLGTRGAAEVHAALRIRQRLSQTNAAVDVFGAIDNLEIPLLFRPLDGLLGACIRLPGVGAGIMVTTRRDLHMQRFTAAHELGHYALQHEGSLDREVGMPGQLARRDLKEVAADAFAAEFLLPKWLFITHARNHGWTTSQLRNPINTYQLSLRMGASYEATCWGLRTHKILDNETVDSLRQVAPKKIKRKLLGGVKLEDPWADVWLIDDCDQGYAIEAGPNDILVVDLPEHAGSGYLWDVEHAAGAGFHVVEDTANSDDSNAVGGMARRRMVITVPFPGSHNLQLSEQRPWARGANPLNSVNLSVSTYGAETEGLPRCVHRSLAQVVLH